MLPINNNPWEQAQQWFLSDLGLTLLACEKKILKKLLDDAFGY